MINIFQDLFEIFGFETQRDREMTLITTTQPSAAPAGLINY
jgi:hypothetical protein